MTITVQTAPADAGKPQAAGPNDAALAAKVDDKNAAALKAAQGEGVQPAPANERPAWLPEKFTSAEDLAKAYAELEGKLGKPAEPAKTAEVPAVTEDSAKKLVADAGLDFSVLSTEVARDGKLSDASIKALIAKGIPQDVIDAHVQGLQASAQLALTEAYATVGGEEAFKGIAEWAAANAEPAQVDTYNALLEAGKIKEALNFLKTAYSAVEGKAPARVVTGASTSAVSDGDVYQSRQEVTADMRSPQYANDPAFRAKVQAKLGRSNVF